MRDANGQFVPGVPAENWCPVGTVKVRQRHHRPDMPRAYQKVAEPNRWILRARVVWEAANGPIPRGYGIHHADGNSLNDEIGNLSLVSKADHLETHRPEFKDRAIEGFVAARKRLRWSTKSATKRTGRHPKGCQCPIHRTP